MLLVYSPEITILVMKEIKLQEHHNNAAAAFLLLAEDDPTLAAEIATNWNEGQGHYETPQQKKRMRARYTRAYEAVKNGQVRVIPDGEKDIICRACHKKDITCGIK